MLYRRAGIRSDESILNNRYEESSFVDERMFFRNPTYVSDCLSAVRILKSF